MQTTEGVVAVTLRHGIVPPVWGAWEDVKAEEPRGWWLELTGFEIDPDDLPERRSIYSALWLPDSDEGRPAPVDDAREWGRVVVQSATDLAVVGWERPANTDGDLAMTALLRRRRDRLTFYFAGGAAPLTWADLTPADAGAYLSGLRLDDAMLRRATGARMPGEQRPAESDIIMTRALERVEHEFGLYAVDQSPSEDDA